jgi:hypothetical protein
MNRRSKYDLLLCHLHNPHIHGKTDDSDKQIDSHYLIYDRYDGKTGISFDCLNHFEEYDTDNDSEYGSESESESESNDNYSGNSRNVITKINDSIENLRNYYYELLHNNNSCTIHPIIRNYKNIISKIDYIKPEIGEYIILPTQEAVAILKTFWLRIIQKKWKSIFKERQKIIKYRITHNFLFIKEITGKWPDYNYLPGLKGMLHNLSNK